MKRVHFHGPADALEIGKVRIERGKSDLVSDVEAKLLQEWDAVNVTVEEDTKGAK